MHYYFINTTDGYIPHHWYIEHPTYDKRFIDTLGNVFSDEKVAGLGVNHVIEGNLLHSKIKPQNDEFLIYLESYKKYSIQRETLTEKKAQLINEVISFLAKKELN